MVRVLRNPGCIPLLLRTDAQAGVRLAAGDAAPPVKTAPGFSPWARRAAQDQSQKASDCWLRMPPFTRRRHLLRITHWTPIRARSSEGVPQEPRSGGGGRLRLVPPSSILGLMPPQPRGVNRTGFVGGSNSRRGLEHELTAPRRRGSVCLFSSRSLHQSIPTSDGLQANGGDMAEESREVLLNGGSDVGVTLVSGADEFLRKVLGDAPAKTGVVVLRVVKNAAGKPFIAVLLGGKHVGFLPRTEAEGLLSTLADFEQRGAVAQAKGRVSVPSGGAEQPVLILSLPGPGQSPGAAGAPEVKVPSATPSAVPSAVAEPAVSQPTGGSHCRTCGKVLPPDARFCLGCGTPVVAAPVPTEGTAAPTPVLPVAPSVAPFAPSAPTAQPAYPAGAPDRSSSGPAELSIGSQIAIAIASLLLLIGPFLPWATAGVFSASGLQKTGNEALLLVGLGAIGLGIAVFSLARKKDSLRLVPLLVGVLSLAFSAYYLYALRDQLGESSSDILEIGIGAGIYVCLVASIVVLLAALAARFGVEKRRSTAREQFSGAPTKGRGR